MQMRYTPGYVLGGTPVCHLSVNTIRPSCEQQERIPKAALSM